MATILDSSVVSDTVSHMKISTRSLVREFPKAKAAAVKALRTPEVRAKFDDSGVNVVGNTPEEFAAVIKASFESAGRSIRAAQSAGVKFE